MLQHNYLEDILKRKRQEVEELIQKNDPALKEILLHDRKVTKRFSKALKKDELAVIGEIKRKSPSLGEIRTIEDPVSLALTYCQGGVSAISVLTDEKSFGGSLEDLKQVREGISKNYPDVTLLRKDFILHPLQLAETVIAGADAVLLIVAAVNKELKYLLQEATRLGLETLTEVHNLEELELALDAQAPLIGVNHRNLKTFTFDMDLTTSLRPRFPADVISVAESGLHTAEAALKMRALGYNAVLIGEALVKSKDPAALIKDMQGGSSEN